MTTIPTTVDRAEVLSERLFGSAIGARAVRGAPRPTTRPHRVLADVRPRTAAELGAIDNPLFRSYRMQN